MKYPLVTIVIVVYNNQKYIRRCLDSVLESSYPHKEIIIVNNASTDQTAKALAKYGPNITVITNDANVGYAAANNQAFHLAKGKYFFVLNPDTTVSRGFLEPLVELMASSNNIAACQPAVFLLKAPSVINLTGKETHYLGFDWIKNYQQHTLPEQQDIVSFSGCAILLNATAIKKAHYFDNSYFMYYEDTDLSWKLRLLNFRLVFQPKSKVYHDYKLLPPEQYLRAKKKYSLIERNRLITILKNYTLKTLCIIALPLLITELAMVAYSVMGGWSREKYITYWEIWTNRRAIIKQRNFIQHIRVVSDQEITNNFNSTIGFIYGENVFVKWLLNPFLWIYWQAVKVVI